MTKPDGETVDHLKRLIERVGTYRAAAAELGLPERYAATIHHMISGKMFPSLRRENVIRHKLNLPPRGADRVSDIPTNKLRDLLRNRAEL